MEDADGTTSRVEEAVRLVRRGETDAYRTVVYAYAERLRAEIAGSCPPWVDTEEAVHMVFIKAYENIGRYEEGTHFYGWLRAIARNVLLTEYERVTREARNRKKYLEGFLSDSLRDDLLQEESLHEDRLHALRSCMKKLPGTMRDLLGLRYYSGESLRSIAGKTGKSVASLKFSLFTIRKRLGKCIMAELSNAEVS